MTSASQDSTDRPEIPSDADDNMARRRNITFFRESEAPSLREAGVMANRNSAVANAGIAKMVEAGLNDGYVLKCLFKATEPGGFSLSYAWFKGNYELPPHKHNTDCLYYVISGELHFGNKILGAGDGFLLPANAGYSYRAGPAGLEILEFRDTTQFDITVRDGSPKAWERLAQICASNKELWSHQRPPTRIPQG